MSPLVLVDPPWWYESYGLTDWLQTLFNQPLEVHTFLLGVFVGTLIAYLTANRGPNIALVLTLGVLLFTFGAFDPVCSDEFGACQHLRLKPWYFLAGYLSAYILTKGIVGRNIREIERERPHTRGVVGQLIEKERSEERDQRISGWITGLLVVVLIGLASYSFVSSTPVHPITGLATIGGLLGSGLGLSGFQWAMTDSDTSGYLTAVWRVIVEEPRKSMLPIGYGGVLGFGYPRLYRELGQVTGRGDFLFGTIIWPQAGLASVVTYVLALFGVTVVTLMLRLRSADESLDGGLVAALFFGYGIYAVILYLLTGYAGMVWYRLIPSVSV